MQDENAFEELFRSYYQPLCHSANLLLNDIDEAEETVQQVFINLWEKRAEMQIEISVKSYLYKAVRNTALNKIKFDKVRSRYAEEQEMLAGTSEPATHLSSQNELQSLIKDAIESLPEQCRIIFKLSRFEEMKYSEIASHLGLSVKTIENQMGKALRIMREKLKDYLVIFLILFHSNWFI